MTALSVYRKMVGTLYCSFSRRSYGDKYVPRTSLILQGRSIKNTFITTEYGNHHVMKYLGPSPP